MHEKPPLNFIRLGYSSISARQIEPGIRKLAGLIYDMI
jgi:GntR family transcriptional regulator/MocR family aminotransferase